MVTCDTAYTALGLRTVKELKRHFRYFVEDIGQPAGFNQDRYLGIATLSNILIPTLLPSCAVLYEEGCRFMNGRNKTNYLCLARHWIIRHHHTTKQEQWKCNHLLDMDYNNIAVICSENEGGVNHKLSREDALHALATMRTVKCWYLSVSDKSVVLMSVFFYLNTWNQLLTYLRRYYDKIHPVCPSKTTSIKDAIFPILDSFIESYSECIVEVPRLDDVHGNMQVKAKFSAYNICEYPDRSENSALIEDNFESICYETSELIEEGYNFLRVEASEILAFVATNSNRIVQPGIPPHIPIAYGMRGHSLSMNTMRDMVDDIRNELKSRNASVLCEVYDGQFHKLLVRSQSGKPLTRIQNMHDHFKTVMISNDRQDLLNKILPFSWIDEEDVMKLCNLNFMCDNTIELETIKLTFTRSYDGITRSNKKQIFIESIPVGGYSMKDFVTHFRPKIIEAYHKKHDYESGISKIPSVLSTAEMQNLISGTKYHRRYSNRYQHRLIDDSDTDDSDDSEYIPSQSEFSDSDSENTDIDNSMVTESTLTNVSVSSTGQSCIKRILNQLKRLDNKHNWRNENVNSLLQQYMKDKKSLTKLFMYEMDIINNEVKSTYGKELFKKADSKSVRIEKISKQLKKLPQLFDYSTTEDENENMEPDKLVAQCKKLMLSRKYPKDYLAAPVCEITHDENVLEWENASTVPVRMYLPFVDKNHIIFNYPEYCDSRDQIELRTFDYTHILNNLRFHICNKGFDNVSTDAFLYVSQMNQDVLPQAIVELKLDRQNCSLSQRFFSEDVQKILTEGGFSAEAEFVSLVRMWFRACDERGMGVKDRLLHLERMYDYLVSMMEFSHYPPLKTHVGGIPIRTYEALLHCISSRFTLFTLSSTKSYNSRAISTLAVESFFSDLSRFEFSGLGAPKSVDIPKLITHIVNINASKHNPNRGFEFTTSTRDNYPCYLMENIDSPTTEPIFGTHAFDLDRKRDKRSKKKNYVLSKPKHIAKGGHGVRQYLKIDETKLTDEQRFGKTINISDISL